jgi:TolB protein
LPTFRGEGIAPHRISEIVRADLERSGLFRVVSAGLTESDPIGTRPDFPAWRQRGADFLLSGSITRLANGRFFISSQLWDTVRGNDLAKSNYEERPEEMRLAAHVIADAIYEKLIGEKSVFATRIAYVTKQGSDFRLLVADSDGENAQLAFESREPIISPAWSRSGAHLAYVSFHEGRPVIYAHEVARGGRPSVVADFRGSNSAPAWSANGRQIIATLSRDGGSQIYAVDFPGGREPRRLTQSNSIDTEPCCSPDGQWIYFVSDRRGRSPQIYRMPAAGGVVELVTKTGSYNISPAISPDSKLMAYISLVAGGYRLHLMDLSTGQSTALTDTSADEGPSFAPNGRLILYETRVQRREVLMTTTIDGRIKVPLKVQGGDIREPDWGPFVRA